MAKITKDAPQFQFTHPGKGATKVVYVIVFRVRFNSRTLGRVRPIIHIKDGKPLSVSIHAPWEGCDEEAQD